MFEVTCYDYTGNPIDFLVQWDTGTTIEIRDIELPETPIIHFANKYSEKSLALRDGVVYENNTLTSPIPDVLLQEPYMLTVYIYAHEYDKNRGKTTNIAKLPIMAKPKPVGYVEKQAYEGINVLALKVNVDKNTEDISGLKNDTSMLYSKDINHDNEIELLKGRVSTNEEAIGVLNGTEEGSVDYKITKAFDKFVSDTSNDDVVNTYKELIDYAADHASEALEITQNISDNTKSISDLREYVGLIPEESSANDVISYTDEQVSEESDRAIKAESALDKRLVEAETAVGTVDVRIATAKSEAITTASEDATSKANAAEKNAKDYSDSTFVTPAVLDSTLDSYYTVEESDVAYASKTLEHEHENQDVLNEITSDQVASWNALAGGDSNALFTSIFNAIYPVGSIYMSTLSTDPSSIFGGTWESWGNGRVPVGVDENQSEFATVEKTGGELTHTLTAAEMPSHTHTSAAHTHTIPAHAHGLNNHKHSIPALSGTTSENGAHTHASGNGDNFMTTSATSVVDDSGDALSGTNYNFPRIASDAAFTKTSATSSEGAHTHTLTTNVSTTGASSGNTANSSVLTSGESEASATTSSGSGAAHNILQPYITCYMWKRVA